MQWWKFLLWNAAGGIAWATAVSLLSYEAGKAVAETVNRYGLYGVLGLIALGVIAFLGLRLWRRRLAARLS
jgi:membrane protein DedA with SNARE-associated domain